MPKQLMTIRNKKHTGPISPRVSSNKSRTRAYQKGQSAFHAGFHLSDNKYRPGLEHDEWSRGYLEATKFKINPVPNRAPEGMAPHKDGYVVVKHIGIKKKWRTSENRKPRPTEEYLGYIKPGKDGRPRRFFPYTNNPAEDKWRNKVACKSYKEPKEEV